MQIKTYQFTKEDNMNRVFTLFMCLYFVLVSVGGFASDVNLVPASPMLAESPWPKSRGPSLHNTGRSPYIGPDSPEVKWVFDLGGITRFRTPSIDTDGTIYAGTDTELFALNPDGSMKWSVYIPSEKLSHVTISEDNFLYVQTSIHKMYKINSTTGNMVNENWPYDFSVFYYTNGVYPATSPMTAQYCAEPAEDLTGFYTQSILMEPKNGKLLVVIMWKPYRL
jgi:hypothetical protein